MNDELAIEYAPSSFYAVLVTAFSTTALALTAIGLFAVLSHAVARRSHEIGLRVALGASRPDVVRLVLGNGLAPLAIGIGIGLAGSVALTRVMRGLLYGVSAFDVGGLRRRDGAADRDRAGGQHPPGAASLGARSGRRSRNE